MIYQTYDPTKHISDRQTEWKKMFAILPKTINGKRIWLKSYEYRLHRYVSIYCRYEDDTYIEYKL